MTCLVVSALLFSPYAWKVGAAVMVLTFAGVSAAVAFAACAVATETDRQMDLAYREAFLSHVEVEPVAIADLASELNVEVN
jgi:hypothetical protein